MTIKEVEQQAGITKANIRFYEKGGLLNSTRGSNNYREYSAKDIEYTSLLILPLNRLLGIRLPGAVMAAWVAVAAVSAVTVAALKNREAGR